MEMKDSPPTHKSSPSKKEIDAATQALNHFAQGKRHLLVHDIASAVNSLQEACRLLAEQYGETAPECGDAYFFYGRALLELSRIESGVLGNALDGVPDEDDAENSQVENPENMTEEGSGEEEGEADDDDESDEPEAEAEGEVNGTNDEGEKTEEEEEVSNLQLAWEMLELSKVIFEKQKEKKEMVLKSAQVYLKLGEVSMENENYSQSVEDLNQCLQIQVEHMEADNRCLAETHYQLGVAHSFSDEFDKAMESFTAAALVIEKRISNLTIIKEQKDKWTEEERLKESSERDDPFYTEKGEIEELEKLLPEIKEKLVDMEEMKKDTKERLQKMKEATFASLLGGTISSKVLVPIPESNAFDSSASPSSTEEKRPAMDISHLVRKKRKPEEEIENEDVKKVKAENGEPKVTNGNVENGLKNTMEVEAGNLKDAADKIEAAV